MAQHYELKPQVSGEVVDGEAIMMNLARGTYFSTTNSGALIWALLENGKTLEEIQVVVGDVFQASPDKSKALVSGFITDLEKAELIESVAVLKAAPSAVAIDLSMFTGTTLQTPELIVYNDMQDLLALDPIHDVEADMGWPAAQPLPPQKP